MNFSADLDSADPDRLLGPLVAPRAGAAALCKSPSIDRKLPATVRKSPATAMSSAATQAGDVARRNFGAPSWRDPDHMVKRDRQKKAIQDAVCVAVSKAATANTEHTAKVAKYTGAIDKKEGCGDDQEEGGRCDGDERPSRGVPTGVG